MLGRIIELSVVVRDLEDAARRFSGTFGLEVTRRGESEQFGFKNAILPTGDSHIELVQPTDPSKAVARFLEQRGEGVYLVGFEVDDVAEAVRSLREKGVRVSEGGPGVAWVHPSEAHGVFVELLQKERQS